MTRRRFSHAASTDSTKRALSAASVAAVAFVGAFLAVVPQAQAAAAWKLTVTPNADYAIPGKYAVYKIEAENVGTSATSNATPIELENVAPAGTTPAGISFYDLAVQDLLDLTAPPYEVCPTFSLCEWPSGPYAGSLPSLPRHKKFVMAAIVKVPLNLEGPLEDVVRVSGGGAPPAEGSATNLSSANPPFGKLAIAASLNDEAGNAYTQAGGRPYQISAEYNFATYSAANEPTPPELSGMAGWAAAGTEPLHDPKDVIAELPPGLLANPQIVPHCTLADFYAQECTYSAQVGVLGLRLFGVTEPAIHNLLPVYNLQPTGAYPGQLGATIGALPVILANVSVRTGSDYGVTVTNVAAEAGFSRASLRLWGVPADPSHDILRGNECGPPVRFLSVDETLQYCELQSGALPHAAEVEPKPFLIMPTECTGNPLPIVGRYNSWQRQSEYADASVSFPAVDGCNALSFGPTIEAQPTTNLADAPSGLNFDLHVPQHEGCTEPPSVSCENATPSLKEAVVKLPAGLSVNPSSGNGLTGCSPSEIGLATPVGQTPAHFAEAQAECPDASAIGTAEVNSTLLHDPLRGVVYLATPHQNPFGSLLAAYIVLEGDGLIFKIPGEIEADPITGQLTSRFLEDPQAPFEDFRLKFFGGAKGDLRTPATCGSFQTTSVLTPFSAPESGPPAEPTAEFELDNGGAPCARQDSQQPNGPVFRAGTESPQAGQFSPFSLRLARADGSQEFSKIETTLPPGLVGRLAGSTECPQGAIEAAEAKSGTEENESPSCPASSQLGTVEVASGAGPTPLYVQGRAYLAGPYKGAPLSLAILTPALAGPFDLGDVLVRSALRVNPETAQITAVSDPIPHILQGIPLDVRSVTLKMDRPNFTLNPTNCEELHFAGYETSILDSAAPLSQRFQVGGCQALRFKPKLSLSLKGRMTRGGTPALTAHLRMKGGEANVAKAQVTLPPTELVDNAHLRNVCTRAQFAANDCPADSAIGHARAVTPLLEAPLDGPVYLMTGFGHRLPDLAIDLNGQIPVFLHGKVDRGKGGGLRNTFEVVPDAPVSAFTLALAGAKRGLIENEGNLCAAPERATAEFTGQNGAVSITEPLLRVKCPKARHRHKHHRAG